MILGAISDTHLRSPNPLLEHIVEVLLADADLILHAGDIVGRAVLDYLEERGVLAVCGNMDDYEIVGSIPRTRIIPVEGKRIGLVHGWGSKVGLEKRIVEAFRAQEPDLIVYGHSHLPFWGVVDGVNMFNPGTPNSRGFESTGTVGIIEILGERIDGRFLSVES